MIFDCTTWEMWVLRFMSTKQGNNWDLENRLHCYQSSFEQENSYSSLVSKIKYSYSSTFVSFGLDKTAHQRRVELGGHFGPKVHQG